MSARNSDSGDTAVETVAVAVAEPSVTVADLDVDVSRLFDAGADETEMSTDGLIDSTGLQREFVANITPGVDAAAAAPERPTINAPIDPSSTTNPPTTKNNSGDVNSGDTAAPSTDGPATTAAPTTAAPTTAAPTTAAPTTAAPTTAAPTTAAPPATDPPAAEPEVSESGEPTGDQWANLRQCESGGSYTIVSGNGLYHGAYQFGTGTWDTIAGQAGRSDLVGVLPSDASAGDQDAMALALWRRSGAQPWPHCGKYLN